MISSPPPVAPLRSWATRELLRTAVPKLLTDYAGPEVGTLTSIAEMCAMGNGKRRNERHIKLAKDHRWKCTPGYMLIAAERGAVSFEAPSGWYNDFYGEPPSIRVCDTDPPDDSCRLLLSIVRYPIMDIDAMPIERFHPRLGESGAHHLRRTGYKLAWTELEITPDKSNGRPVRTLMLWGLAPGIQAVLSMAVYEEDFQKRLPLWHHVVETFDMGRHISDPSRGTGVRPILN